MFKEYRKKEQICEICGDKFTPSTKRHNTQRWCGSWRTKVGCSWKMYALRLGHAGIRRKFIDYTLENHSELIKNFFNTLSK